MSHKNYHENLTLKSEQLVNQNFTIYVLPSVPNTTTGLVEKSGWNRTKLRTQIMKP